MDKKKLHHGVCGRCGVESEDITELGFCVDCTKRLLDLFVLSCEIDQLDPWSPYAILKEYYSFEDYKKCVMKKLGIIND